MELVTPHHYLAIGALLFGIGFFVVVVGGNVLLVLMSLELMLNGVNVALVSFSRAGLNLDGSLFVFFIMTVAAAEVALGLALLVALYKRRQSVFSEDMSLLRN